MEYSEGNQDLVGTAESVVIFLWNQSDPTVRSKKREIMAKGERGTFTEAFSQRHFPLVKRTLYFCIVLLLYICFLMMLLQKV